MSEYSYRRLCGVQIGLDDGDPAFANLTVFLSSAVASIDATLIDATRFRGRVEQRFTPVGNGMHMSECGDACGVGSADEVPQAIVSRLGSPIYSSRQRLALSDGWCRPDKELVLRLAVTENSRHCENDRICLSALRVARDFGLMKTGSPALVFPVTDDEANARVERLISKLKCLAADSEAADETLTWTYRKIVGGFDTPLLDFDPEADE